MLFQRNRNRYKVTASCIYSFKSLSGKKVWKITYFPGQEKSGNFTLSKGNLEKMKKVREFKIIPKKFMVNRLLKIIISNWKQFIFRSIPFLILV